MMNVRLRKFNDCDIKAHCEAVVSSIKELGKWFTWAKEVYCECDSYGFITNIEQREEEGRYDYAIMDEDTGEFLGACSLNRIKTHNGEKIASMNYWVRTNRSNQGIMKKAAIELVKNGFDKHGFDKIEIDIAYCNRGSREVALYIGAKPERDIAILGGDGRNHKGTKYTVNK